MDITKKEPLNAIQHVRGDGTRSSNFLIWFRDWASPSSSKPSSENTAYSWNFSSEYGGGWGPDKELPVSRVWRNTKAKTKCRHGSFAFWQNLVMTFKAYKYLQGVYNYNGYVYIQWSIFSTFLHDNGIGVVVRIIFREVEQKSRFLWSASSDWNHVFTSGNVQLK